jgi:hypothetical protein
MTPLPVELAWRLAACCRHRTNTPRHSAPLLSHAYRHPLRNSRPSHQDGHVSKTVAGYHLAR